MLLAMRMRTKGHVAVETTRVAKIFIDTEIGQGGIKQEE
jgi:hypothetical protein